MINRLLPLALAASVWTAHAADFSSIGALTQDEFLRLSRDLGAAISYKGVTPATPLGILGFDVGIEVTDTKMESSDAFSRAGAGGQSHLVIPKLHVYKGLWGGLDIGAFIGGATEVNATLYGADLRYAILDDGLTTPAVALRLAGTKASGLGDLDIATVSVDAMPSAGGTGLEDVRFNKGRVFGGLNVNLIGANFAFEAEKMGGNTSLSAKLGLRF